MLFKLFFSLHAFSDQIYLKNGRKIEGIIEKEEDSSIILNIGFGTIKLNREEIDYVARDNLQERDFLKQKWRDKYFTRLEFVPDRLKDIIYNFRYLKQSRSNALRSKQINDNLLKKINKQEEEIKKLDSEIKSMSADGLLGMSFLENFIVRIDGKNNKLILEEFDL